MALTGDVARSAPRRLTDGWRMGGLGTTTLASIDQGALGKRSNCAVSKDSHSTDACDLSTLSGIAGH